MRRLVAVVGTPANEANVVLVSAWRERGLRTELVAPAEAAARLRPGDVAVGRLDVRPTLDGIEPGLLALRRLARRGVRVVNGARALVAAHDKLAAARLLERAAVAQPRTACVTAREPRSPLAPPVVLKPRFGSWGRDVIACRDPDELERALRELHRREWFRLRGAIVQELVPDRRRDVRLVVAGGRVIGASERLAAAGEWRTNVSLGGRRAGVEPPADACALASRAAAAVGAELVGVDVLPLGGGGHTVLELNAAIEFDDDYSFPGEDVYVELAARLGLAGELAASRRG